MTREQDRARMSFEHVKEVAGGNNPAFAKRYATVVFQLTTMTRTAGIVQSLEFMAALSNREKRQAALKLLDHVGEQMERVGGGAIGDGDSLRNFARSCTDLQSYLLLGREIAATLVWYRRFVQSILRIAPGEAMTREDDRED